MSTRNLSSSNSSKNGLKDNEISNKRSRQGDCPSQNEAISEIYKTVIVNINKQNPPHPSQSQKLRYRNILAPAGERTNHSASQVLQQHKRTADESMDSIEICDSDEEDFKNPTKKMFGNYKIPKKQPLKESRLNSHETDIHHQMFELTLDDIEDSGRENEFLLYRQYLQKKALNQVPVRHGLPWLDERIPDDLRPEITRLALSHFRECYLVKYVYNNNAMSETDSPEVKRRKRIIVNDSPDENERQILPSEHLKRKDIKETYFQSPKSSCYKRDVPPGRVPILRSANNNHNATNTLVDKWNSVIQNDAASPITSSYKQIYIPLGNHVQSPILPTKISKNCPICDASFDDDNVLQEHANDCLDNTLKD